MAITFVVGTGRCGSTMLSRIMRGHSEVLSISEFFTALRAARRRWDFPVEPMDGRELWAMLATPVAVADGLVPAPIPGGAAALPVIRHHVLPMLTDNPDDLLGQLAAEVPRWPRRPASDQYRGLFGFLASRLRRHVVVERSGASLLLLPLLREQFPEAKFVHMHRDGPDCALSMSRHPMCRREALIAEALKAARNAGLSPSSPEELEAAAPAEFKGLLNPPFDEQRFMSYPIPLTVFAKGWWSAMICRGMSAFDKFPADVWTSLKYEDLLAHPRQELARIANFIGVPADPRWLESACRLIEPSRAGRAEVQLDPETLASVRAACEPGARALASAQEARV